MLWLTPTAAAEDKRCSGEAVSGASNPLDAPALHTSTTYAINGTAAGKRSYVVFQPQVTGEYQLYLVGRASARASSGSRRPRSDR